MKKLRNLTLLLSLMAVACGEKDEDPKPTNETSTPQIFTSNFCGINLPSKLLDKKWYVVNKNGTESITFNSDKTWVTENFYFPEFDSGLNSGTFNYNIDSYCEKLTIRGKQKGGLLYTYMTITAIGDGYMKVNHYNSDHSFDKTVEYRTTP